MNNLIPVLFFLATQNLTSQWHANYQEDSVPDYDLPEILVDNKGNKINTIKEWESKRRAEIIEQFAGEVYGRVPDKKIRIETLCLEEESAQTIKRTTTKDYYNLSRLGIPLIEIATAPDITNPEECKETAAHLGMILRSMPNCKRGIGSIRQDVNISINKGNRVELKGFQDIRRIPQVINKEIQRHLNIIKQGKKVEKEVRKVEANDETTYQRPMPGADRMYPETDIEPINTKNIKIQIQETIEQKIKRYQEKYELSKDLATKIVKQETKKEKSSEEKQETKQE
ncbi:MAG: hypothetical protein ACOC10_03860, partial [Bacteroidota bacterium]